MRTPALEVVPRASRFRCTEVELVVDFDDGRTLSVPLVWFPRLLDATAEQRANWRLTGQGEGIHWADLEEDLSVAGLLRGEKERR